MRIEERYYPGTVAWFATRFATLRGAADHAAPLCGATEHVAAIELQAAHLAELEGAPRASPAEFLNLVHRR